MRKRILLITIVVVLILGTVTLSFSKYLPPLTTKKLATVSPTAPFSNIVTIVMENQGLCSVYTGCGGSATYQSNLANSNTLITTWGTIGHNSEPNYIALVGAINDGSTNGDGVCCYFETGQNIVDKIEGAGLTWTAWAEDASNQGTCSFSPPRNGDHFGFIDFADMTSSRCTHFLTTASNTSPISGSCSSPSSSPDNEFVSSLTTNAPNFIWLTPNDCDNAHDSSIGFGDTYLSNLVPKILSSPLFVNNKAALLILYDEGYSQCSNTGGTGECVYASLSGPVVKKNTQVAPTGASHYSYLSMIETAWGLGNINSNDAGAPNMLTAFGASCTTNCPPPALTVSVTSNPNPNTVTQAVSFTATITGGTLPYKTYSWSFGDGASSTVQNPNHTYSTQGTYSVTFTVTDNAAKSATGTISQVVNPTNCGTSCPPPPCQGNNGVCPVQQPPVLVGWGGVRLDEATLCAVCYANTTNAPSAVFPGQTQSDLERLLIEMKARGLNVVRVSFDPQCTDTIDNNYMSQYTQANAQAAVNIAKYYNFWIILDYHGATPQDTILPAAVQCWINFWTPIIQNIGPMYTQIIWEPFNEPIMPSNIDVGTLSTYYQQWITNDRTLGDTHWIVVQNLCSNTCGFTDMSQGYPTVQDNLGKILISLHPYMGFPYVSPWTLANADVQAQGFYAAMISGHQKTGWFWLNTEGGTDPLCGTSNSAPPCPSPLPDLQLSGSSGYTTTTLRFMQTLTSLLDHNNPRIDWVWWPAGSWTNTPGAGTYGALEQSSSPAGWGTLLSYLPYNAVSGGCTINCPGGGFNLVLAIDFTGIAIAASAVVYFVRRRK